MDCMEKEYGIKESENYYITHFKIQEPERVVLQVKGKILNFTPSQVVIKSDKGLYIIQPVNIVEMRPLFRLVNSEGSFVDE